MSKSVSDTQARTLWLSRLRACEQALEDGINFINQSRQNQQYTRDFRLLCLAEDVVSYFKSRDYLYHDREEPLILKDSDYITMEEILSRAIQLISNIDDRDGFFTKDDSNYELLLDLIKIKLGDDIEDFYNFVDLQYDDDNPTIYNELLNLQQHKDIVEKYEVLQKLKGKDYKEKMQEIKKQLATPQKRIDKETDENYTSLLQELDDNIWSDEISYNYELILLAEQMKSLNITRYFPAIFSNNVSKRVKLALNAIENAHGQNAIDIRLLSETISLLRLHLAYPDNAKTLMQLNANIEQLKESPIKFYLKSVLITSLILCLATAAITISIQFGVDSNIFLNPVNQVAHALSSIFPPLKDFGLTIYNGIQKTAFVLPKIMGGDSVPIWSLAAGAVAGSVLGLAGGKAAAKFCIMNAQKNNGYSKLADHDKSSEFGYDFFLDDESEFDDESELGDESDPEEAEDKKRFAALLHHSFPSIFSHKESKKNSDEDDAEDKQDINPSAK